MKKETPQQQARKEMELLFLNLRDKRRRVSEGPVKIIYPKRFHPGHFIIAALVPIDTETIHVVGSLCRAHKDYHYPPVIINSGGERRLRLIWRFPEVSARNGSELLQLARDIAKWAEDLFNRKAIVFPDSGIVATRLRLCIE